MGCSEQLVLGKGGKPLLKERYVMDEKKGGKLSTSGFGRKHAPKKSRR
jgi:hypothetical protein